MLDIANKEILPAILRYARQIAETAEAEKRFLPELATPCEEKLLRHLNLLLTGVSDKIEALHESVLALDATADPLSQARHCRDRIFLAMQELRCLVDEAEGVVDEKLWPFPGYGVLLTTK